MSGVVGCRRKTKERCAHQKIQQNYNNGAIDKQ